MQKLTDQGWQKVIELSQRYFVSTDAVLSLLQALINGGGTMAQFYHSELGGGGQWMRGGMTMVGDMFNHSLKSKVDGLCGELSNLLSQQPFVPPPPVISQQQSQSAYSNAESAVSLFVQPSGGAGDWWPAELGSPNSSGGQNNIRYAYFANARRLAVELNGQVNLYDTLNHQIGGVSQQQGGGSSLTFTSQFGTVRIEDLPLISNPSGTQNQNVPVSSPSFQDTAPNSQRFPVESEADVFTKIERLGGLLAKGMISQQEFDAKKAELLSRI